MTSSNRYEQCLAREALLRAKTIQRMFDKIVEDLTEAYFRTPSYISSKTYVERGLRLARAGAAIATELVSELEALAKSCS